MTRARVEGLLTSFPKLIPTNSQHTSVETADVRYVYQPLEDLYILLITNKGSNILQDIDTLHLFARVVSDLCRTADEKEILRNAFELLSAFDEIVSLGYRENVNLMQVRSILEMESHEERIQDIISRVSTPFTLLAKFHSDGCIPVRTKKQRQRRNSRGAQNNSNSNDSRLLDAMPVEAVILAVARAAIRTRAFLATKQQVPNRRGRPHLRYLHPPDSPRSRALA